jgi:hypothetical protein
VTRHARPILVGIGLILAATFFVLTLFNLSLWWWALAGIACSLLLGLLGQLRAALARVGIETSWWELLLCGLGILSVSYVVYVLRGGNIGGGPGSMGGGFSFLIPEFDSYVYLEYSCDIELDVHHKQWKIQDRLSLDNPDGSALARLSRLVPNEWSVRREASGIHFTRGRKLPAKNSWFAPHTPNEIKLVKSQDFSHEENGLLNTGLRRRDQTAFAAMIVLAASSKSPMVNCGQLALDVVAMARSELSVRLSTSSSSRVEVVAPEGTISGTYPEFKSKAPRLKDNLEVFTIPFIANDFPESGLTISLTSPLGNNMVTRLGHSLANFSPTGWMIAAICGLFRKQIIGQVFTPLARGIFRLLHLPWKETKEEEAEDEKHEAAEKNHE